MNAYTPPIAPADQDQLLTAAQAARLLGVHLSTVRRWIARGKLPAYRIGDKGVRLRYADVAELIRPIDRDQEKGGRMRQTERITIPPLTEEEAERGRQAVEDLRRFRQELLARRGGIPFPSSADLITQMRDERTRELMRGSQE